ncbi:MAG TPA: phosphotransferase [Streptosporangiaceae bacterium]|nr:phosphotransferase [Streptosporangiaceae bacterium]
MSRLELLPHGYTNRTTRSGAVVTKAYLGPDAARRGAREAAVLRALAGPAAAGQVPVPAVLGQDGGGLRMEFLPGVHGQELVDAGKARAVLRACGQTLGRIHAIAPAAAGLDGRSKPGEVLVHGDYGPNNVLLDLQAAAVTAVLDWEWAHRGDPVEDLAWCEWIIRMHHRAQAAALPELWSGYGWAPPWAQRQQAMAAQCRALIELCQRWEPDGPGIGQWRERLAITLSWTE